MDTFQSSPVNPVAIEQIEDRKRDAQRHQVTEKDSHD